MVIAEDRWFRTVPCDKQRVHAMFEWIAANDAVYGLGDTPLKVYQRWTEQVLAETGTTATLAP
ncbi:MAG: hypothetical protein GX636_09080, partial [Actinomycetales bacterium]|nr:hypothetical protein [Actinomycetales bacterium]